MNFKKIKIFLLTFHLLTPFISYSAARITSDTDEKRSSSINNESEFEKFIAQAVEMKMWIPEYISIDYKKMLKEAIDENDVKKAKEALKNHYFSKYELYPTILSKAMENENFEIINLLSWQGMLTNIKGKDFDALIKSVIDSKTLGINIDNKLKIALLCAEDITNDSDVMDLIIGRIRPRRIPPIHSILNTRSKLIQYILDRRLFFGEEVGNTKFLSDPIVKKLSLVIKQNKKGYFDTNSELIKLAGSLSSSVLLHDSSYSMLSINNIPAVTCLCLTLYLVYKRHIMEPKKLFKSDTRNTFSIADIKSAADYINEADNLGMTAQMWLIVRNDLEAFIALSFLCIKNNITQDLTATNICGQTPLMLAIKYNRHEMWPILRKNLLRISHEINKYNLPEFSKSIIGQYLYGFDTEVIVKSAQLSDQIRILKFPEELDSIILEYADSIYSNNMSALKRLCSLILNK